MGRVDYTGGAEAYRRARALPSSVLARWQDAIAPLARPAPGVVLDLGAGPGAFLGPMADWTGASVVAVEPSGAMRAAARDAGAVGLHPHMAAIAECLPIRPASVDWAWLSAVIHQFDDRAAAAAELRRVVRPGGRVLVRGFLADVPVTGLLAAFPGMTRAARAFPSTDEVVSCLDAAGFTAHRVVDVVEPWRFDVADWLERVRGVRGTDSLLRHLTDEEFEEGLRIVADRHRGRESRIESDVTLRLVVMGC